MNSTRRLDASKVQPKRVLVCERQTSQSHAPGSDPVGRTNPPLRFLDLLSLRPGRYVTSRYLPANTGSVGIMESSGHLRCREGPSSIPGSCADSKSRENHEHEQLLMLPPPPTNIGQKANLHLQCAVNTRSPFQELYVIRLNVHFLASVVLPPHAAYRVRHNPILIKYMLRYLQSVCRLHPLYRR